MSTKEDIELIEVLKSLGNFYKAQKVRIGILTSIFLVLILGLMFIRPTIYKRNITINPSNSLYSSNIVENTIRNILENNYFKEPIPVHNFKLSISKASEQNTYSNITIEAESKDTVFLNGLDSMILKVINTSGYISRLNSDRKDLLNLKIKNIEENLTASQQLLGKDSLSNEVVSTLLQSIAENKLNIIEYKSQINNIKGYECSSQSNIRKINVFSPKAVIGYFLIAVLLAHMLAFVSYMRQLVKNSTES